MSILSELSRRFHMLTTDSKPDPPRVKIENTSQSTSPNERNPEAKSLPSTPHAETHPDHVDFLQRQKSVPCNAIPIINESSEKQKINDSQEPKKPHTKAKIKSKQNRQSNSVNVVKYNIVNSNKVKIGSTTNYICNINHPGNNVDNNGKSSAKSKVRPMTEEISSFCRFSDEITFEEMLIIKTHVGYGWRDIARRLSYSDGQIQQFEENYKSSGIDEVIYQLLLDWKRSNTKHATIGNLVSIMWESGEYDCVERLLRARRKAT